MNESLAAAAAILTVGTDGDEGIEEEEIDDNYISKSFSQISRSNSVKTSEFDDIVIQNGDDVFKVNSRYSQREEKESQKFEEGIKAVDNIQISIKEKEYVQSYKEKRPDESSKRRKSINFNQKFLLCNLHTLAFDAAVGRMKGLIAKDALNLSLVVHEPEIWRR